MAQAEEKSIISKMVEDEVAIKEGIPALVDRQLGIFLPDEGIQIDYKERFRLANTHDVCEIARDLLGYSNTDGGLLLLGVADSKNVIGHESIDGRKLRNSLGPYVGTRLIFNIDEISLQIKGGGKRIIVICVHRSLNSFPNLLRKDIEFRPGIVRKLKYLKGTLFYRLGDETIAESPYGDVETKARELRFSGAAPRTRTSFLLQEDKPGLRIYAPINDHFFGRENELAELISKFDDPRGRGVSISGFGGVGKTELAIRLVSELLRRGKFRTIYSASAKQTLLGPGGVQQTDPVFTDLKSFLADLVGWLGLNVDPRSSKEDLAKMCKEELSKDLKKRILLFVDNLETVKDRGLLSFLDHDLPSNCWLVATARVHKVRNYVSPIELREMDEKSAAHLLRHELKRQGLEDLAGTSISDLIVKANILYCHPLAIRWFAWACKKRPNLWTEGIHVLDKRDLENFCVAHTLGNLEKETQKVLGAIVAISDTTASVDECIQKTSGVNESVLEQALWELECAGLIFANTDLDGITNFSVAPLAERPASELARKEGWEGEYVHNLRSFVRGQDNTPPESPLVRDLLKFEPHRIQLLSKDEKNELITRIERTLTKTTQWYAVKLKWLRAECERHLENLVTADELYRECAESVLDDKKATSVSSIDRAKILLEAATVAKLRAATEQQFRRGVQYLEAIGDPEFAPKRVLGMLTEFYAILGEKEKYQHYVSLAIKYQAEHTYEDFLSMNDALERARVQIEKRSTRN